MGPRQRVPVREIRAVALVLFAVGSSQFVAAVSPRAPVQQAAEGSETVYIDGTSRFPIMVQLPADYDAAQAYTLVVGLHGHGGRQVDFFEPPARLFRDAGLIYAVPQAPYAYLPSNRIGYSWNLRDVDDRGDEATVRYIADVVESMRERYNVGAVYLMGFSQGGTFTYYTAIAHPELFAGLATFGSRFSEEWFSADELAGANRLRAFVAGGTRDPGAQPARARHLLAEAGFDVELYEFDAGHTITRAAMEQFIDWVRR